MCVYMPCVYVYVCVGGEGGGGGSSIFLTSRKFPDNVCVHGVVYMCMCMCVCVCVCGRGGGGGV